MRRWLLRFCLVAGPPAVWMSARCGKEELNVENGGLSGGNVLDAAGRGWRASVWAARAAWDYYNATSNVQVVDLHTKWAGELLDVCSRNGGVYIKAGQLLSTIGVIPPPYRECLSCLQDNCDPQQFSIMSSVVEDELGQSLSAVFHEIDPVATAAASIAQVHRAQLNTGEEVAVKIQYPGLKNAIFADLAVLMFLSRLAGVIFPSYQLDWVFHELSGNLSKEVDFLTEIKNAKMLKKKFQKRTDVRVPHIYTDLSSSKLLVMEWIHGCKVTDTNSLIAQGVNPRHVALKLIDLYSEMVLVHGFIHGDPHPGNLLAAPVVRWDGSSASRIMWIWRFITLRWWTPFQVVVLDHGHYLGIDDDIRMKYCTLWGHLIMKEDDMATKVAEDLCQGDPGGAQLLPKLMQRRMTLHERRRLQRDAGLLSLSDIMALVHGLPQSLVDAIRIMAIVRHVASGISAIHDDRVCIEASEAKQGLLSESSNFSWKFRFSLSCRLLALELGVRWRSLLHAVSRSKNPFFSS